MQHLISDQLAEFAAIYSDDVELISVERPQLCVPDTLWEEVFSASQRPRIRWTQAAGDLNASTDMIPTSLSEEARELLSDEISSASEVLGELVECEQIGVRLQTLSEPMCPRFHVDNVPCRMLITLRGVGTEWISHGDVDWHVLNDLETVAAPLKKQGRIQNLTSGHWSLLKGGAWSEDFDGVVHRSPHDEGDRLLLSLDPIF